MKVAIRQKGQHFSIEEVPKPNAGAGEVVLKVSYCGICDSDVGCVLRDEGVGAIFGHQFSGVIAEIGEGVEGWSVGQRVTPDNFAPCWRCYFCLHGTPRLCQNAVVTGRGLRASDPVGGYAEYVKVKASQLYATPEEITDQEAVLAQPLSNAVFYCRVSGITLCSTVAIIGTGGNGMAQGLLALQCAKLSGAKGIYVAEGGIDFEGKVAGGYELRMSMAKQLGADLVIDPREKDFKREVRQQTGGVGADVSLNCARSAVGFQLAMRAVRSGGCVVSTGITEIEEFHPKRASKTGMGVEIKGSMSYTGYFNEFADALDLMRLHMIKTKELITWVVPLNEINEAFNELLRARKHIEVLIAP